LRIAIGKNFQSTNKSSFFFINDLAWYEDKKTLQINKNVYFSVLIHNKMQELFRNIPALAFSSNVN